MYSPNRYYAVLDDGNVRTLCWEAEIRAALKVGGWHSRGDRWWVQPDGVSDPYKALCDAIDTLLVGNDETGRKAIEDILPYIDRLEYKPAEGTGHWEWVPAQRPVTSAPLSARRLTITGPLPEIAMLRVAAERDGTTVSQYIRSRVL